MRIEKPSTKEDIKFKFYTAIIVKDIVVIEAMLKEGFDVNESLFSTDPGTELATYLGTPFVKVFSNSNGTDLKIGELLLRYGAKPDFRPLFAMAISDGNIEQLEFLLKLGADPNQNLSKGITPLKLVCADNISKPEMIELLLQYGANPDFSPLPETVECKPLPWIENFFNGGSKYYRQDKYDVGRFYPRTTVNIEQAAKSSPLLIALGKPALITPIMKSLSITADPHKEEMIRLLQLYRDAITKQTSTIQAKTTSQKTKVEVKAVSANKGDKDKMDGATDVISATGASSTTTAASSSTATSGTALFARSAAVSTSASPQPQVPEKTAVSHPRERSGDSSEEDSDSENQAQFLM